MNGIDIQKWNMCLERASELGMEIVICGDSFHLMMNSEIFHIFSTVDDLYWFLYAFKQGMEHAKKQG